MTEEYFDSYVPVDSYGFSKYICSKYIESTNNIVNLRVLGTFGRYEDYEYRFISNAIVKNIIGLPIVINQNVFFDFLYINDFARIVEIFMERPYTHKSYNIVTGVPIDLVSIAKIINSISDKPSEIIVKNPGLNTEYTADNTRLTREFKTVAFTPFEDALQELYRWYQSIINTIDRDKIAKDNYIKYCRTKND